MDWQEYAKRIQSGRLGLTIPPVLAIVLSRCARRDAIPGVVRDLRDEWGPGRKKVWQLVGELERARTLNQVNQIEDELAKASKLFSPRSVEEWPSPLRMLWNFSSAGAQGAAQSTISSGTPATGALTSIVAQIMGMLRSKSVDGRVMFRRGAFDLARRVSHAAANVDADPELLSRFLTDSEKLSLGY
jgi:antitoxin component of RelBE/YafQ-DinJ toxin-antitoxin module